MRQFGDANVPSAPPDCHGRTKALRGGDHRIITRKKTISLRKPPNKPMNPPPQFRPRGKYVLESGSSSQKHSAGGAGYRQAVMRTPETVEALNRNGSSPEDVRNHERVGAAEFS